MLSNRFDPFGKRSWCSVRERVAAMWIVALICIIAIAFLLVCLRGFQSALKPRHASPAILTSIPEGNSFKAPRHKAANQLPKQHEKTRPKRISK
jgi:hypothetical protein